MEPFVLEITEQTQQRLCERDVRSYFSASRFYNPAISLFFTQGNLALRKDKYIAFHRNYFVGLSRYARGVLKKELREIIKGLQLLCDAIGTFQFKDFLLFDGIFQDSVLLVNPHGRIQLSAKCAQMSNPLSLIFPDENPFDPDSAKAFPIVDDDSIELQIDSIPVRRTAGAIILPRNYFQQFGNTSIRVLYESGAGKKSKDDVIELFGGRENIDTNVIGSLAFPNPFSQILSCNLASENNAFANALECLRSGGFKSAFQESNKGINKNYSMSFSINELMEKFSVAETTLRQFIKSEENQRNGFITKAKRGKYMYKSTQKDRIASLLK